MFDYFCEHFRDHTSQSIQNIAGARRAKKKAREKRLEEKRKAAEDSMVLFRWISQ